MKSGIIFAVAALLLAFPAVYAQSASDTVFGPGTLANNFPVPTGATTTDPIAMLGSLTDLLLTRAPAALSQIANLCINAVMVVVAFVQLTIQLILYPSGLPLLVNLSLMGLMSAFNFGVSGLIYGGILGLPLCLVGSCATGPIGAIVGALLGFFYGFFNASSAKLPPEFSNPYLESWKGMIPA